MTRTPIEIFKDLEVDNQIHLVIAASLLTMSKLEDGQKADIVRVGMRLTQAVYALSLLKRLSEARDNNQRDAIVSSLGEESGRLLDHFMNLIDLIKESTE